MRSTLTDKVNFASQKASVLNKELNGSHSLMNRERVAQSNLNWVQTPQEQADNWLTSLHLSDFEVQVYKLRANFPLVKFIWLYALSSFINPIM